jgi:heme exporter protein D
MRFGCKKSKPPGKRPDRAMLDLGPHAVFIWGAYGITAAAVTALAVWIVQDERRQMRRIAELEAKGLRRRSAKRPAAKKNTSTANARRKR